MRNTFAKELTEFAKNRPEVVLLSGDIGNRMFDEYKTVAPDRFINCGIAEGNMMSLAAGLALSGMKAVVYTITPFVTTRCLEQIKIDVAYQNAAVTIVGTGSGLSYSELGPTHHSFEDMAVVRSIPGIRVLAPSDTVEMVGQLRESIESGCPTYIRIGKKGEPILKYQDYNFRIGDYRVLKEGEDLLVLGVGPILCEALKAADILALEGYSTKVVSMGGIKPINELFLREMAKKYKRWITIEEHSIIGGLGSTILEWASCENIEGLKVKRIGLPDRFINELGSQDFTRHKLGLDSLNILKEYQNMLGVSRK